MNHFCGIFFKLMPVQKKTLTQLVTKGTVSPKAPHISDLQAHECSFPLNLFEPEWTIARCSKQVQTVIFAPEMNQNRTKTCELKHEPKEISVWNSEFVSFQCSARLQNTTVILLPINHQVSMHPCHQIGPTLWPFRALIPGKFPFPLRLHSERHTPATRINVKTTAFKCNEERKSAVPSRCKKPAQCKQHVLSVMHSTCDRL